MVSTTTIIIYGIVCYTLGLLVGHRQPRRRD